MVCYRPWLPVHSSPICFGVWPLHTVFLFPLPSDPLHLWQSVFFHAVPLLLVPSILAVTISFGILAVLVLSVCPPHHHSSDLVNFTVLAPYKCILYLLLCSFAGYLLLSWDHNFYYPLNFEYSLRAFLLRTLSRLRLCSLQWGVLKYVSESAWVK